MRAEELVQAGKLEEALASLQDAVRLSPEKKDLRVFLFQLLCVLGKWERAFTQLQVLEGMDAESKMLAQIFYPVLNCEALRADIFAGKRTPVVFGEPEEWVGWLVQANQLLARNEFAAAAELRDRALAAAPAIPGKLDERPFEWLADADSRLGPILEVILEGRYTWVPLHRVRRVRIEAPVDLRDLVWISAGFQWTNGGEAYGMIPARYPETILSSDGGLRLSRRTEWEEKPEGFFLGKGQRLLATDLGETPLLEARTIEFEPAAAPSEQPAEGLAR